MRQPNPYAAPARELTVDDSTVGFGNPVVFSWNSRIGRLRYLARVCLSGIACNLLLLLFIGGAAFTGAEAPDAALNVVLAYLVVAAVSIFLGLMFAVQRLHDLNHTGWLSLLMVIPVINFLMGLYLVFARGTAGKNDYGLPPPPNTLGVTLAGLILPLIAVIGIIAAIAIPAYQEYALRAQQAQQLQLDAE